MRRTIPLLFSLLAFALALAIGGTASGLFGTEKAYAATSWESYTDYGSSIDWRIDDDGVLQLRPTSGNSGVLKYDDESNDELFGYMDPPWFATYWTEITGIEVEGSIEVRDSAAYLFAFGSCDSLDISQVGLTYSNIQSTKCMFSNFNVHSNAPQASITGLSTLDTSKVTNMAGMFESCLGVSSLALGSLDTSAATDMSRMFAGCENLASLDVSGFDTGEVVDMSSMFASCSLLTSLDLGNFDTSKVEDMSAMFAESERLLVLDLTPLDTSSLTTLTDERKGMFQGCSSLTVIYDDGTFDVSGVDTGRGTDLMFSGCTFLVGGEGTAYDSNNRSYTYAHIDEGVSNPGYFTHVRNKPIEPTAIPVKHTMETSSAVDLSGITYSINATPVTTLSAAQEQEGGRPVPNGVTVTPLVITPASATTSASSTEYTKIFEDGIAASTMFGSASNFGLPGVYYFTISESHSGGSSADTTKWSYGDEQYLLRLYVVNDGQGGLRYDAANIRLLTSGVEGAEKSSSLDFSSSYVAYETLTITKEVEGSFGNASYDFPFEITLILPEWYDTASPIASTNATETSVPARTGDTGPFTGVYTAALHDGESATFTVPVGTYYKVDEKSSVDGSSAVLDGAGIAYDVGIDWTVSQETGSGGGGGTEPVATIPEKEHVNLYTMSELQTISADIRDNGTDSPYYSTFNAFAQAGENVTVTPATPVSYSQWNSDLGERETITRSTLNATLVDASEGYGLVFMLDNIDNAQMNSSDTNAGGWSSSAMRTSLRSGGALYNQYLDGMTMSLADATPHAVTPASVTTYSADYNGGTPQQQTTTGETFFLASITEIYGPTSSSQYNYSWDDGAQYERSCHQFAYFANLGVTGESYSVLDNANGFSKAAGSDWWLRSAYTYSDSGFWKLRFDGYPYGHSASMSGDVLPCFCL